MKHRTIVSARRRATPTEKSNEQRELPRLGPARYLTDGVHLYEVERRIVNYGLLGGHHVVARDCKTEDVREMGTLEVALCTELRTPPARHG